MTSNGIALVPTLSRLKIEEKLFAGAEKLIVTFNGSNDEGFIERVYTQPDVNLSDQLKEAIENGCYDLLECHRPGWEIDEGAYGKFVFDFKAREVKLEFHVNTSSSYEYSEWL